MKCETKYKDNHVKVIFKLVQDETGYPPEEWESLWAVPLGGNMFRIDNIPFYVPKLSCDDIVATYKSGNENLFKEVKEYSENSTIRMIIYNKQTVNHVRKELIDFGCDVEKGGVPGFIAISIPPSAKIEPIIEYIEEGHSKDLWDYEEASLRY